MPYFVFYGVDRPDMEETRTRIRPAHQARLREEWPGCRAVAGGPLTDDSGEHMNGTLLVFEADDRAAVEAFMAQDPYIIEGVFHRFDIRAWRWGLNPPA